jgi:hypothetical protein
MNEEMIFQRIEKILERMNQKEQLQSLAKEKGLPINELELTNDTKDAVVLSVIALMIAMQEGDPRYRKLSDFGMQKRSLKVELINDYKQRANMLLNKYRSHGTPDQVSYVDTPIDESATIQESAWSVPEEKWNKMWTEDKWNELEKLYGHPIPQDFKDGMSNQKEHFSFEGSVSEKYGFGVDLDTLDRMIRTRKDNNFGMDSDDYLACAGDGWGNALILMYQPSTKKVVYAIWYHDRWEENRKDHKTIVIAKTWKELRKQFKNDETVSESFFF